jgi:ABC-type dipeptide/oligopeptide/nickel transport system ATPase component
MGKLIELKKLSVHYQKDSSFIKAVENVDMIIHEGETVGIVGESGSGKSTVALAIMRLIDDNGKIYGEVLWNGSNLLNLSDNNMQRIRGEDIAMVFQDPFTSLNPVIKVGEQIAEVFRVHKGLNRRAAWDKAVETLKLVHIKDAEARSQDYPHQFSGGMRQRVAIAMSYALSPRFFIADEPTTALDVTMQKQILDLLRELHTTILFISHDISLVSSFCSRVYVMRSGRIVEEGPIQDIIGKPREDYTKKLIDSYKEINIGHN